MLMLAAINWIAAALVMAALWAWQRKIANAGIAEAAWPPLVGALAVLDAALGNGAWTRRSAIAWMMGSWGARLGVYLVWDRVLGRVEPPRYRTLRAGWREQADARFFWLFQKAAAAAAFFSLPAALAVINRSPALSPLELGAALLWVLAFAGETTADRQLLRFRNDGATRGRICRAGLWRYSRHPNYFFEWLMWVAYGLFASASPGGWVALGCPALMLYLLCNVTGIPRAEAQALQSRGDEYRMYQQTTSAFLPWFPRS
jgi:steroid 5-alpha reductase family enzyme